MRYTGVIVASALAVCSPAKAAVANPLIGRWVPQAETNQLKKLGVECAHSEMVYTATTAGETGIPIGPYPATRQSRSVRYNLTNPRDIWVIPTGPMSQPGHVRVLDSNHIQPEAADGCVYRRAG